MALKNLFFSKKDTKQDKTKMLIQIIDRIEKEQSFFEKESKQIKILRKAEKEELQDIKIDIIENIPLTNEKKIFLKKKNMENFKYHMF